MAREERVTIHEYSFTVLFEPDSETGGYVVTCPVLPGVVTQGETIEEARAMAADAIHLYLQSLLEDGEPIPADIDPYPQREPVREKVTVAVHAV